VFTGAASSLRFPRRSVAIKRCHHHDVTGEDSGDATTSKHEDSSRLVPALSSTFVLASPSDFDASTSAVYEISGISSDAVVFHADPHIEEVTQHNDNNDRFMALCPGLPG